MGIRRWQNLLAILLGVWLFFSPFYLHYTEQGGVAAWNVIVVGLAMVVAAVARLIQPGVVPHWPNLVVGVWLIASPWLLRYDLDAQYIAVVNQLVLGILLGAEGIWAIASGRHGGGRPVEDAP